MRSALLATVVALVLGACKREAPDAAGGDTKGSAGSNKSAASQGLDGLPSGPPSSRRPDFRRRPTSPARKNTAAADPSSPTSSAHRGSKYSADGVPAPGQAPATRTLPPATTADEQKAKELATRVNKASSKDDVQRALDEAAGLQSAAIIPFVRGLMQNPDPDVQGRALALLDGVDSEEALPAIAEGLASTDEDVRLMALDVLESIDSENAASLLATGMSDPDKDVRQAALANAVLKQSPDRDQLVASATRSPYVDVAITALNVVRSESRKATTPVVIEALGHSNPLVRDLAHEMLFLTFQNDLTTPAQATQWWNAHQQYFDENLALKDPADLSKILPEN